MGKHDDRIEILGLRQTIDQYSASWDALVSQQALNPSLGPAWTWHVAVSHGVESSARVLLAFRNERLVLVVPHLRRRVRHSGVALDAVSLVANLVSYHNSLVTELEHQQALELFLSRLDADWHCLLISGLHRDAATFAAAMSLAQARGYAAYETPGENSPYLQINGTWDDYVAGKRKKFRYKLRKRAESLQEDADLTLVSYSDPAQMPDLMAEIAEIESRSWKSDAGLSIHARDHETDYYRRLLPWLAGTGHLSARVLRIDDQPVAYGIGCHWDRWYGFLKTSFDTGFARRDPGTTVLDTFVREAFESGADEFDFLGSDDEYKLQWTKTCRAHVDLAIYNNSLRGRLATLAKRIRSMLPGDRGA